MQKYKCAMHTIPSLKALNNPRSIWKFHVLISIYKYIYNIELYNYIV